MFCRAGSWARNKKHASIVIAKDANATAVFHILITRKDVPPHMQEMEVGTSSMKGKLS